MTRERPTYTLIVDLLSESYINFDSALALLFQRDEEAFVAAEGWAAREVLQWDHERKDLESVETTLKGWYKIPDHALKAVSLGGVGTLDLVQAVEPVPRPELPPEIEALVGGTTDGDIRPEYALVEPMTLMPRHIAILTTSRTAQRIRNPHDSGARGQHKVEEGKRNRDRLIGALARVLANDREAFRTLLQEKAPKLVAQYPTLLRGGRPNATSIAEDVVELLEQSLGAPGVKANTVAAIIRECLDEVPPIIEDSE